MTVVALSVAVAVLILAVAFVVISPQPSAKTATTTSSRPTAASTTSFAYLSDYGGCSESGEAAPCWGGSAYVFDCLSAAGTPQGCTQLVSTTSANWNYTINIRYPFSNETGPSWANCLWSIQGKVPVQGYAYCDVVNSTSFTIGIPSAPPQ